MRVYNPLSVEELGSNAARALMGYPSDILPPQESFSGAGVYVIHYAGSFPAYANTADDEPIYVGKADLPGKRLGHPTSKRDPSALHNRLSEHAASIEIAENLDLGDFRCRWLVLDPVWIGLTEQVLISEYRPVWNVIVAGFGNHDPGGGRRNQRRSEWDTLHPGRRWADSLADSLASVATILAAVAAHRA